MAGKPASVGLGSVAATISTVYLCAVRHWASWRTWGAGLVSGGDGGIGSLALCVVPTGTA